MVTALNGAADEDDDDGEKNEDDDYDIAVEMWKTKRRKKSQFLTCPKHTHTKH